MAPSSFYSCVHGCKAFSTTPLVLLPCATLSLPTVLPLLRPQSHAFSPSSIGSLFLCSICRYLKKLWEPKEVSLLQTGLFEGAFGSIWQSTNPFSLSPSHVSETTILQQDGACPPSFPPLSMCCKKIFFLRGSQIRVSTHPFSMKMLLKGTIGCELF